MKQELITEGRKGDRWYMIYRGHLQHLRPPVVYTKNVGALEGVTWGAVHAYARYAVRGTKGESYLKLYKEPGRGRFPVTVRWLYNHQHIIVRVLSQKLHTPMLNWFDLASTASKM